MEPREGGCIGISKLGGEILEEGCQDFKEMKVRVWIESKNKKWGRELSGFSFL
jgi:hypothetical protein